MKVLISLALLWWYVHAGPIQPVRVIVTQKPGVNTTYGQVHHIFRDGSFNGFSATVSNMQTIKNDPDTIDVEPDIKITTSAFYKEIAVANWGLDRIDQTTLPLDNTYTFSSNGGRGVNIYIMDTGIDIDHVEFKGRATWGANFVPNSKNTDENGHGTHVTGIAIGTWVGVAKAANAVAVKVLNAQGNGYLSNVIAGLNWIDANGQGGIVNLSFRGTGVSAIQTRMEALINKGYIFCVAAGNSAEDACQDLSSCSNNAITVAASAGNDFFASFSNFGSGIDIIAPGQEILSSYIGANNGTYRILSGTSMASPFVAGAVALLKGVQKSVTAPQAVAYLKSYSVRNAVEAVPLGTPNNLLYVNPLLKLQS